MSMGGTSSAVSTAGTIGTTRVSANTTMTRHCSASAPWSTKRLTWSGWTRPTSRHSRRPTRSPTDVNEYLGLYQDVHGGPEEPHNSYIQGLARDGLSKLGHHGAMSAMGVPLTELPRCDDL